MFIVFTAFWLPAIGFLILLLLEYTDIRAFFKNSKKTSGKVVGRIGAQHKKLNSIFSTTISKSRLGGEIMPQQAGINKSGMLLLVEYEHQNGNIYQVRSKQSFNDMSLEEVTVNYNPKNASDIAIEGFYANTSYVLRLIGIAILFAIPIIIACTAEF